MCLVGKSEVFDLEDKIVPRVSFRCLFFPNLKWNQDVRSLAYECSFGSSPLIPIFLCPSFRVVKYPAHRWVSYATHSVVIPTGHQMYAVHHVMIAHLIIAASTMDRDSVILLTYVRFVNVL